MFQLPPIPDVAARLNQMRQSATLAPIQQAQQQRGQVFQPSLPRGGGNGLAQGAAGLGEGLKTVAAVLKERKEEEAAGAFVDDFLQKYGPQSQTVPASFADGPTGDNVQQMAATKPATSAPFGFTTDAMAMLGTLPKREAAQLIQRRMVTWKPEKPETFDLGPDQVRFRMGPGGTPEEIARGVPRPKAVPAGAVVDLRHPETGRTVKARVGTPRYERFALEGYEEGLPNMVRMYPPDDPTHGGRMVPEGSAKYREAVNMGWADRAPPQPREPGRPITLNPPPGSTEKPRSFRVGDSQVDDLMDKGWVERGLDMPWYMQPGAGGLPPAASASAPADAAPAPGGGVIDWLLRKAGVGGGEPAPAPAAPAPVTTSPAPAARGGGAADYRQPPAPGADLSGLDASTRQTMQEAAAALARTQGNREVVDEVLRNRGVDPAWLDLWLSQSK